MLNSTLLALRKQGPFYIRRLASNSRSRSESRKLGRFLGYLQLAMNDIEKRVQHIEDKMFAYASKLYPGDFSAKDISLDKESDLEKTSEFSIIRLVKDNGLASSTTGEGYFKVQMDMRDIMPTNIQITLEKEKLTVSAQKDRKQNGISQYVEEYIYTYDLPKSISQNEIKASVNGSAHTAEDIDSKLKGNLEIKTCSSESDGVDPENKSDKGASKK